MGIFKKNPVNIAHLPTLMLAIGYPLYWAEMYLKSAQHGVTSPAAALLFCAFFVFLLIREREAIANVFAECRRWFGSEGRLTRCLIVFSSLSVLVILACALYAAQFPPHLKQESDMMNYHYSLTRQHLIIGSFERIPWSGFDLYLLPVDYALAPYWFVTELPNKFPQFIFFGGLVMVLMSLGRYLKNGMTTGLLITAALLLGSHGHGVQMGSAMLDLTNCYLFIAALDSFFRRMKWLFIIEASFFIWSKSFMPVHVLSTVILLIAVIFILRKCGFKEIYLDFQRRFSSLEVKEAGAFLRQCALGFFIFGIAVAGPFIAKSLYYAGTPLYPFALGMVKHQIPEDSIAWSSLKGAADYSVGVRDGYGYGRSLTDLLKHFWLVAVPTKGVNNAFDYPLGLSYLIVLGPFLFFLFRALAERKIPVLPILIVIFWALWFASSQQSRWLYVPLALMFLVTAFELPKSSRLLWLAVIFALLTNAVSVVRAHRPDFGKTPQEVLREEDRTLVDLSRQYLQEGRRDTVLLEQYELAFARFPVVVRKQNLPHVIGF